MNWPPVFHLQWLGHVPHVRQHLPTTIVWNSPMRELIDSVMVSSLLFPTFGTLSLPLYFRLPSTFLLSKGRSTTTLGTRWHNFSITLFRYFINLFYSFPLLEGYRLEKGHIKKKKKMIAIEGFSWLDLMAAYCSPSSIVQCWDACAIYKSFRECLLKCNFHIKINFNILA